MNFQPPLHSCKSILNNKNLKPSNSIKYIFTRITHIITEVSTIVSAAWILSEKFLLIKMEKDK